MKSILIVEPDLAFAMSYLRAFIAAGFHTEHATNVAKALAAMNDARIDGVVLSLRPRDSRTLRFLDQVRSTPSTKALPVVAFARDEVGDLIDQARIQGATECLYLGRGGAGELVSVITRLVAPEAELPAAPVQTATVPVLPVLAAAPPPPEPQNKPVPPTRQAPPPAAPAVPPPGKASPIKNTASTQKLKEVCRALFGTQDPAVLQPHLLELHHLVQVSAAETEARQFVWAANLVAALLALLKELGEHPRRVSSSNVRTILQAINCLEMLVNHPSIATVPAEPPFKILAVDDEPAIRELVRISLGLARLTPDSAEDASAALKFSGQAHYELFILDVNMPGLTGFELCEKLRASAAYRQTPVIFVTGSDNFESRVRSAGSGGTDFIGKPFLPHELAVKALIHLLPRRVGAKSG